MTTLRCKSLKSYFFNAVASMAWGLTLHNLVERRAVQSQEKTIKITNTTSTPPDGPPAAPNRKQ